MCVCVCVYMCVPYHRDERGILDEESRLFLQSLSPTRLCHTLDVPCMLASSTDDGVSMLSVQPPFLAARAHTGAAGIRTRTNALFWCPQVISAAEAAQLANALRAGGRRTATLVASGGGGGGADVWSGRRRHRQLHLGSLLRFFGVHL